MLYRLVGLFGLPYVVNGTIRDRNTQVLEKFNDKKLCSGTFAVVISVAVNAFTSADSKMAFINTITKTLLLDKDTLTSAYNSIVSHNLGITSPLPPIPADISECVPLETEFFKFFSMDEEYAQLLVSAVWKLSTGVQKPGERTKIMESLVGLLNHDQISVLNLMSQVGSGNDPVCTAIGTAPGIELLDPFKTSGLSVTNKGFNHGNFLVPLFSLIRQLLACGGNNFSDRYWKIEEDHVQDLNRILGHHTADDSEQAKECSETYSVILAVAVHKFIKRAPSDKTVFSSVLDTIKSMKGVQLVEAYNAIEVPGKPALSSSPICDPPASGLDKFYNMDEPFSSLANAAVDRLVASLPKGSDFVDRKMKKDALDAIILMFTREQQTALVSMAKAVGLKTDPCDLTEDGGAEISKPTHNLLVVHFAHVRKMTPCIFGKRDVLADSSETVSDACSETFAIVIAVAVDAFVSREDKSLEFAEFLQDAFDKDENSLFGAYDRITSPPSITSTRNQIVRKGVPRVFCQLKQAKPPSFKTMSRLYRLLAKFSISRLMDVYTTHSEDIKEIKKIKETRNAALDAIINRFTDDQKEFLTGEAEKAGIKLTPCDFSPLRKHKELENDTGYFVDLFVYVHRSKACITELIQARKTVQDLTLKKLQDMEDKKCSDYFARVVAVAIDKFVKAGNPEQVNEILTNVLSMDATSLSDAFSRLSDPELTNSKLRPECARPFDGWKFISMDYDDQLIISKSIYKLHRNPELRQAALNSILGIFTSDQIRALEVMEDPKDKDRACGEDTLAQFRPFEHKNYLVPVYAQIRQILKCNDAASESESQQPVTVATASVRVEDRSGATVTQSLPIDDQSFRSLTAAREQRKLFSNLQRVVFVISQSHLQAVNAAVHLRTLESYIMVLTKALDQIHALAESKKGIEAKLKDVLSQVSIAIGRVPTS